MLDIIGVLEIGACIPVWKILSHICYTTHGTSRSIPLVSSRGQGPKLRDPDPCQGAEVRTSTYSPTGGCRRWREPSRVKALRLCRPKGLLRWRHPERPAGLLPWCQLREKPKNGNDGWLSEAFKTNLLSWLDSTWMSTALAPDLLTLPQLLFHRVSAEQFHKLQRDLENIFRRSQEWDNELITVCGWSGSQSAFRTAIMKILLFYNIVQTNNAINDSEC